MRLSDFIRQNQEAITIQWVEFAKTASPASRHMTVVELKDHIKEILSFIAHDIESPQTEKQQVTKSYGEGPKEGLDNDSAAETHAVLRLEDGFDIDQMVSEYRALRASIIKLWRTEHNDVSHQDMEDIIRFNEAVDQTIAESVRRYTKRIDHSRNMFLGILGHDLRNPIGAASMCGQLMIAKGTLDSKMTILAAQVIDSTARANIIINDLLDFTRAGVGSGLTVSKELADMGIIAQRLVDEMVAISKGRKINLDMKGDMQGEWDVSRIEQVFSNLIGNALQYSFEGTPIAVIIDGTDKNDIKIMVHNQGIPIPTDKMTRIFDALTRATTEGEERIGSTNLGLGLYITKEIVIAHQGTIKVTSSQTEGTIFTVILPRA